MNFNGTDPNSPFFLRANDKYGKQIDAPSWWISGARPPGTSRWRVARSVGTRSAPRPAPTAHGEARRRRPPVADVHTRPNTVLAVIARRWLRVLTPAVASGRSISTATISSAANGESSRHLAAHSANRRS